MGTLEKILNANSKDGVMAALSESDYDAALEQALKTAVMFNGYNVRQKVNAVVALSSAYEGFSPDEMLNWFAQRLMLEAEPLVQRALMCNLLFAALLDDNDSAHAALYSFAMQSEEKAALFLNSLKTVVGIISAVPARNTQLVALDVDLSMRLN